MSVGTARAGLTVTAIRDGDRVTVYDNDGEPIGYAMLDPAKSYVPFTRLDPTQAGTPTSNP
jgi:hypothetical protein